MDAEITELFASKLNKMKKVGGDNQYIALCPYHDDKNASFSLNTKSGLWNCKSCGEKGNAYKFADDWGHPNPKQFINENDSTYRVSQSDKSDQNTYTHNPYDDTDMMSYINAMDSQLIPNFVDPQLVKQLGIGLKGKTLVFAYKDVNDNLVGHKVHKQRTYGDAKCHWYPKPKIPSFKQNKPLYICEGEKDVLPLLSLGYNAITSTGGCLSIPKDLNIFQKFESIVICYDNDDGGRKGSKKLGDTLKERYPNHSIKIIQWDDNLPNKFDVWDAYNKQDNAMDFYNAVDNAVEVKETKRIEQKTSGFKTFNLEDFIVQEYKTTEPIIESITYNGQTTLIGGDTGTKKSWIGMQCALSIASGVPLFEHFKVNKKKVLLVQFENENYDIQSRFKLMLPYYINKSNSKDWIKNMEVSQVDADDEIFVNNWEIIDNTLNNLNWSDCVLVIDNLYTSTNRELQDNHDLSRLLREIHHIKKKYDLTMIFIGHSNKGVSLQKCLDKDQLQGGKTLINNMANVVMTDVSRASTDLNIMKIVKGGRSDKNELLNIPFKLHWSDDTYTFKKGTIIKNEAIHFDGGSERWEIALILQVASEPRMVNNNSFDRMMFRESLPQDYKHMSDTKLTRLIDKLIQWGLIKRLGHNSYQLERQNIGDFV